MHVVSTSSLPIDLAAPVTSALPGTTVSVPAAGHVGLAGVDLRHADALVCLLLDTIDARVLAGAPQLRVIANCAVGVDNIDLAAAARGDVAGHQHARRADRGDRRARVRADARRRAPARRGRAAGAVGRVERAGRSTSCSASQLAGKTLGIVGFGRIGQAMARRALGFGMRVIYADPHEVSSPARRVEVDDLFATADVVSLHCPLTAETREARRRAPARPDEADGDPGEHGARRCVDEPALDRGPDPRTPVRGRARRVRRASPQIDPRS